MSYEEARAALESHAHKARRFLAARPDVEPEILYYLASDESVDVRRLVAGNPTTPQQANKLLTSDSRRRRALRIGAQDRSSLARP